MLNPRLLVVLSGQPDADAALDTVLSALSAARRPYGLRFALPARFQEAVEKALLATGALGAGDLKYFDEAQGLAALPPLLGDETHFLYLRGLYGFASNWDATLYRRFGKIRAPRALMTAMIQGEAENAQACLPAIAGFAGDSAVRLGAGIALVASVAPAKTLLINPAFLLSRVAFLRNADLSPDTLSIAAYAMGFPVFALDCAPLWPLPGKQRAPVLVRPGPEALPPTVTARFEQMAAISFAQQTSAVRSGQGLFQVEDGYPQRLPARQWLAQSRHTLLRRPDPPQPLVVTAFIDQPEALKPPQHYMIRFAYLMGLRHLPLTLYAGGAMERQLRARFPNTLAYPDHSLLPRSLLAEGMTPMQLMRRSKLLLLMRTLRAYPSFSHVMWLDIDALPHPVCPQAMPDFAALMDDRVHIAWVDGEPDASAMVVPKGRLLLLVREVQAATQFAAAAHSSFGERDLMRHLVAKYPDVFTLHPLPQRALLFLTCFDPALRSAPVNALLASQGKPIRVPPATPPPKEKMTDA